LFSHTLWQDSSQQQEPSQSKIEVLHFFLRILSKGKNHGRRSCWMQAERRGPFQFQAAKEPLKKFVDDWLGVVSALNQTDPRFHITAKSEVSQLRFVLIICPPSHVMR